MRVAVGEGPLMAECSPQVIQMAGHAGVFVDEDPGIMMGHMPAHTCLNFPFT